MFTGGPTEAQMNQYSLCTSDIKTIEKKKPLKLRYCFRPCTPSLGHFIGRREPSTYLDLSRKARISGKSF